MRAIVIREHGGPEALRLEEIPDPTPGPGEVQVRVRACALNHLDVWIRQGIPGAPFHLPATTGADIAGEVSALGSGVDDVEVGAPVMVMPTVTCGHCEACASGHDNLCRHFEVLGEHRQGGLAELISVPRANIFPMPGLLSFHEAAAASLTPLTAWHMLVARAALREGETVLIQAAGSGVGTAAVQIARHLGARVIATAGSQAKLDVARRLGAHETINYKDEDFVRAVKRLTNRRGADVIVEHVGGATFEGSLRALGWGGRLVTCGATTGADVGVNLRHIFYKNQSILGSTMGTKAEYHHLLRLLGEGVVRPVIHATFPLESIVEAQRVLEDRAVIGKVVVTL